MKKLSEGCFQIVSGPIANAILLIIRNLINTGRIARYTKAFNPS